MKSVKKLLYSILAISFFYKVLIKNFVYADVVVNEEAVIDYSPLYYISIMVVIAIVVSISVLILRKIYKNNQLEKENKEGVEK